MAKDSKSLAGLTAALIEVTALGGEKFLLNPSTVRQIHARVDGGSSLLMTDGSSIVIEEELLEQPAKEAPAAPTAPAVPASKTAGKP